MQMLLRRSWDIVILQFVINQHSNEEIFICCPYLTIWRLIFEKSSVVWRQVAHFIIGNVLNVLDCCAEQLIF